MIILNKIISDVIKKIESHRGLSEFIINLAKFEGWLKVEIIDSAIKLGCSEVIPEKDLIDVTFNFDNKSYAIELKTINTNYQKGFSRKTRPITKNISGVIKDIEALQKNGEYKNKFVLFIVFPLNLEDNKKKWNYHLKKIESLVNLIGYPLRFKEGPKGILYMGEVDGRITK